VAVPTVTRNAAVLFARMLGEVPNPLAMVGAVEEMMRWPPLSANDVELVVPVTARPVEVAAAIEFPATLSVAVVAPFTDVLAPLLAII